MTPLNDMHDPHDGAAAERLNELLDSRARSGQADSSRLDPTLVSTVERVSMLAGDSALVDQDAAAADRLWQSLIGPREVAPSRHVDRRVTQLGIVAQPIPLSPGNSVGWWLRAASVLAAVLLAAVMASHYGPLSVGPSTATAMAAAGPVGTATRVAVPSLCPTSFAPHSSAASTRIGQPPDPRTPSQGSPAAGCHHPSLETAEDAVR